MTGEYGGSDGNKDGTQNGANKPFAEFFGGELRMMPANIGDLADYDIAFPDDLDIAFVAQFFQGGAGTVFWSFAVGDLQCRYIIGANLMVEPVYIALAIGNFLGLLQLPQKL